MDTKQLGSLIRERRKSLGMTQVEVALGSHVGTRFLSDLENGKETSELGKTLDVLHALGMNITISAGE